MTTSDATVTVTDSAARRIRQIVSGKAPGSALRIAVNGGGCSGFQYDFSITTDTGDDDTVIERDGARVLIDSISLVYMAGSSLDFVDDLMGQAFKVNNPQAKASCGCGTSFSI
jgi:iron-sulfur cluster assembly accessory protein